MRKSRVDRQRGLSQHQIHLAPRIYNQMTFFHGPFLVSLVGKTPMRSGIQFVKDPIIAIRIRGIQLHHGMGIVQVFWDAHFFQYTKTWRCFFGGRLEPPKIGVAIFKDQYWKDLMLNYLWKALGIGFWICGWQQVQERLVRCSDGTGSFCWMSGWIFVNSRCYSKFMQIWLLCRELSKNWLRSEKCKPPQNIPRSTIHWREQPPRRSKKMLDRLLSTNHRPGLTPCLSFKKETLESAVVSICFSWDSCRR